MTLQQIIVNLRERQTTLNDAIDPTRLATEEGTALADFGPDGKWKYAPQPEKDRARAAVQRDQRMRAKEAQNDLAASVREAMVLVTDTAARARLAPSAEEAWRRTTKRDGLGASEYLQLLSVSELTRARLAVELQTMPPGRVLSQYRQALEEPDVLTHALLIAAIEDLAVGENYHPPDGVAHAGDFQKLATMIQDVQNARVPEDVAEAAAEIDTARKVIAIAGAYQTTVSA